MHMFHMTHLLHILYWTKSGTSAYICFIRFQSAFIFESISDGINNFQIMQLFLLFIGIAACFDEFAALERERRDLMWFNRNGNNIFNHRHMSGSRPRGEGKFLLRKELNLSEKRIRMIFAM